MIQLLLSPVPSTRVLWELEILPSIGKQSNRLPITISTVIQYEYAQSYLTLTRLRAELVFKA